MAGSCKGCKFLFGDGEGYSNYTWMDTLATCALGKNTNLPLAPPYQIDLSDGKPDIWEATKSSRCDRYAPGPYITIDPDREDGPAEHTSDAEAIDAICKAANVKPNGGYGQ